MPLVGFRHDAAGFASFQIHIDAIQPDRVGQGLAPIHVSEQLLVSGFGRIVQRQKAFAHEKGIQMDGAVEGRKAMVGNHQQRRVRSGFGR